MGLRNRRSSEALAAAVLLCGLSASGGCTEDGAGARPDASPDAPTEDAAMPDVGTDAPDDQCAFDEECSNGVFCDGEERCAPDAANANAVGCVQGTGSPCAATQTCDEGRDLCLTQCETEPDADGDGHPAVACGGDDCDDADGNRYPGNEEICDDSHHDEDCDLSTYGFVDADSDGSGDATCCNIDEQTREQYCGSDCNDMETAINPNKSEICDGEDNDCDGEIDEDLDVACVEDADGDRHAPPDAGRAERCGSCESGETPEPQLEPETDCFDGNADVHAGQRDFFTAAYCPQGGVWQPDSGCCWITPDGGMPRCAETTAWDYNCDGCDEAKSRPGCACQGDAGVDPGGCR